MILLRYAGIFIIIAVLIVAFWAIFAKTNHTYPPPAQYENNPKTKGLGIKSVRLLDRLNTDNTLIGNDKWREEMQDLLDEWYGK